MAAQPQRVHGKSPDTHPLSVVSRISGTQLCNQPVRIAALSIECISKPEDAETAHITIPAVIHGAFGTNPAFAGSLVLVSDKESRLMSVVTFWNAKDRLDANRIYELLTPNVDHFLRIRTADAYLVALPESASLPGESIPGHAAEAKAGPEASAWARNTDLVGARQGQRGSESDE